MTGRLDDDAVLDALIAEIRRIGRFPTYAELKMRRRLDPEFPSHGTISARGKKAELAAQILDLLTLRGTMDEDILGVLSPILATAVVEPVTNPPPQADGQVYLLKLGKHYKIGRSNAFGRRERELAIQMPQRAATVHVIVTDDPPGIEAYWHRRFADRRVRKDAEWFLLSAEDVTAFRRRRFQ